MNEQFKAFVAIFAVFFAGLFMAAGVKAIGRMAEGDYVTVVLELPQPKASTAIYEFGPGEDFPPPPPEFAHLVELPEEDPYVYRNFIEWSDEDKKCLADNIYFEAKNQSMRGQVAVALVTMNRVNSPYWPNTVCGVVHEEDQFSWYWDGKPDNPIHAPSYEQATWIADGFLSVDAAFVDFTYGSDHYHADYVEPFWIRDESKMVRVKQIETHIFYRAVVASR